MGKRIMKADKKRHMITLTESVVVRFQEQCKAYQLPPATMSIALDDALKILVETMEQKGANLQVRDLFTMREKQLDLIKAEVKENGNKSRNAKVGSNVFADGRKAKTAGKKKAA